MNPNIDGIGQLYSSLSSRETGLTEKEASQKIMTFGENILPEKKKNYLMLFLKEFTSPLVILLFGAIGISLFIPFAEHGHITLHDAIEAIAIFIILIFNALLGFFQELKAENTLQALKHLQPEMSTVWRDGILTKISAEKVVPGDIISIGEGEKIPADVRLIEAIECTANESLLTGESLPVEKDIHDTEKNILYSGSDVLSGRAKGIIVATGFHTQIGKIAQMISEIKKPKTPMEKKIGVLGKKIAIAVILICIAVFFLALAQETIGFIDALLAAVALAVGAVPEGLPAVMTISLAIGVAVMARKNALIRELKAVETLGSITVIASDKTGTITENRMSVEQSYWEGRIIEKENFSQITNPLFFEILENCNDAKLPNIGDPTEIGLLELSQKFEAKKFERIDEIPFSSEKKWMSTTHEKDGDEITFYKGAPEIIAGFCTSSEKKEIVEAAEKMARNGIRTIALASQKKGDTKATFQGIAGLKDPARKGVKEAITTAKRAGIQTIMITGDHAITAQAIAHQVGIKGKVIEGKTLETMSDKDLQKAVKKTFIYARVSPEHKVRICKALQENGEVVGMTGDGVNDAPAITQAQVGISMGKVGTAVARNASDMVLLDDNFTTIIHGISEGRRIFSNIKKSIVFLLATNLAEVIFLFFALLFLMPLPLLPIQLLLINLLTDSFPALALAAEDPEDNIMSHKPKPLHEGFLYGQIQTIGFLGALVGFIMLALFSIAHLYLPLPQAQTLAFAGLSAIELIIIFSLRSKTPLFSKEGKKHNPWVLRSSLLGFAILFGILYSPIGSFLQLENFPILWWLAVIAAVIIATLGVESFKYYKARK